MPNDLVRSYPIPHGARLHEGVTFNILKSHPAYFAAKNGDVRSAAAVVRAYAPDVSDMPPGMSFLPVAALDRYGSHNALPVALATYLASKTDGRVHLGVVQTNRAGHTGARAMERLVSRAYFDGSID